jgi:hypothetical protein
MRPLLILALTLTDLFLRDSNWRQLLARICTTSIQRQLTGNGDAGSFPNEYLFKTIRETALAPRNWQLDAKDLAGFQRGSITCRA